jgi:hypothetical protein
MIGPYRQIIAGDIMRQFVRYTSILLFFTILLNFGGEANAASSLNLYWINGYGSWFGFAPVEVDGKKVSTIKSGKQLRIAVAPGKHLVRIHIPLSFESAKLVVNVASNGEQYLKVSRDMNGFFFNAIGPVPMFKLNLRAVPQSLALAEIRGKKKKKKVGKSAAIY